MDPPHSADASRRRGRSLRAAPDRVNRARPDGPPRGIIDRPSAGRFRPGGQASERRVAMSGFLKRARLATLVAGALALLVAGVATGAAGAALIIGNVND